MEKNELDTCIREYSHKLEESDKTFKKEILKKEKIYQFFAGLNTAIFSRLINERKGILFEKGTENFISFIQPFFDIVFDRLLGEPQKYRLAIYVLDHETNSFHFIFANQSLIDATRSHSRKPFVSEGSLAAHALTDKSSGEHFAHIYLDGEPPKGKENPPFLKLQEIHDYKSTIACAINPTKQQIGLWKNFPEMVLCVDFVDNIYLSDELSHLRTIVALQSIAIAESCIVYDVSQENMKIWLRKQYWFPR
jgi:hypothetical protein